MRHDPKIQEAAVRHAQGDMAEVRNAGQARIVEVRTGGTAPSSASVFWAAWRQGLKDLQTAVLGPWGGTHEEIGTIANPVPREVYEERHGEDRGGAAPTPDFDSYEHGLSMAAARGSRDQERGHTR